MNLKLLIGKIDMQTLAILSTAFDHEGDIPSRYTCDGDDVNPPLEIQDLPAATQSLVLIVDDPDAPGGTFDHWVVWNIPPHGSIGEDASPGQDGLNSLGENGYTGPCPPDGTHRYFFKVYALDTLLDLPGSARKADVESAMQNHILAFGELMGRYRRR